MTSAFGHLGDRASGLAATHFFTWFNLESAEGGTSGQALYRPSGDAFRDLVRLTVDAPDGRIEGLNLALSRDFIEDAHQGAFARDIVKSFLDAMDAKHFAALIAEVLYRDNLMMLTSGSPPDLAATPSAAYQVFSGASSEAEVATGPLNLAFSNADGWFSVDARRAGSASPSLLDRLLGR